MRDAVIQLMLSYTDRDLLKQAYIKLGLRNHCELIIDMLRRECGYEVLPVYGKTCDDYGEPYNYSLQPPEITVVVREPIMEEKRWIVCRICRDELNHISRYSKEQGFKGVSGFVLSLLRTKGYIRPQVISSNPETTGGSNG